MIRKLLASLAGLGTLVSAQDPASDADIRIPTAPPSRYTVDFHVYYGFNAAPDSTYSADMVGGELGGALYVSPRQALTLGISVAGDAQTPNWDGHRCPEYDDPYDRVDISLLAGYRFTHPLGRYLSLTLGAKGGLDVQRLSVRNYYFIHNQHTYHCETYRTAGTRCGFGYAGYAEIGLLLAPGTRITAGYQYHGATTEPRAKDRLYGDKYSARDMRWHEIRIGLDYNF